MCTAHFPWEHDSCTQFRHKWGLSSTHHQMALKKFSLPCAAAWEKEFWRVASADDDAIQKKTLNLYLHCCFKIIVTYKKTTFNVLCDLFVVCIIKQTQLVVNEDRQVFVSVSIRCSKGSFAMMLTNDVKLCITRGHGNLRLSRWN